jgi:hypothetical protein
MLASVTAEPGQVSYTAVSASPGPLRPPP